MANRRAPSSSSSSSAIKFVGWVVLVLTLCVISGVVGGAVTRNFGTSNYTLSYADFISILLSALSVMLTLLGLILAILAVVGWRSITTTVENRTETFLDEGFRDGNPLHDLVITRAREIMFAGILDVDAGNEADDTGDNLGREE